MIGIRQRLHWRLEHHARRVSRTNSVPARRRTGCPASPAIAAKPLERCVQQSRSRLRGYGSSTSRARSVADAVGATQVQRLGAGRSSRRGRSRSACVANDRLRHMRAPDPAGAALEFRPGGVAASQSPAPFVSGCSTRTSSPVPRRRLPRPWPACRGSRTVRRQPVREAWSTGNSLESRLGATPRQAATARRAACRRGSPPSRLVPSAVEEAVTKTSTGPPAAAGCTVRRCPHPARCPRTTTARADRQGLTKRWFSRRTATGCS